MVMKSGKEFLIGIAEEMKRMVKIENDKYLRDHSWYAIPEKVKEKLNYSENQFDEDDIENINKIIVEHYSSKVNNIIIELSKLFPNRKEIFAQIHNAIKRKDYYTAIPTILTQVDGISQECLGGCYFNRFKITLPFSKEEIKKHGLDEKELTHRYSVVFKKLGNITVKEFKDHGIEINDCLNLMTDIPIFTDTDYLDKFPDKLNRHSILHGFSTDYGTEVNTYKVLLLLNYLSSTFVRIKKINGRKEK